MANAIELIEMESWFVSQTVFSFKKNSFYSIEANRVFFYCFLFFCELVRQFVCWWAFMQLRLNAFVDYLFGGPTARAVINKTHNKTVQKDGMTKSEHGYGHMHTLDN